MTLRDRSATYERQRQRILAAEPLCRYCLNRDGRIVPATVLDHIIALALAGSNEGTNLAPACCACNDAKSTDEKRYLAGGYDPGDIIHDPALAEWLRLARVEVGSTPSDQPSLQFPNLIENEPIGCHRPRA